MSSLKERLQRKRIISFSANVLEVAYLSEIVQTQKCSMSTAIRQCVSARIEVSPVESRLSHIEEQLSSLIACSDAASARKV